jgi:hypothetical protein
MTSRAQHRSDRKSEEEKPKLSRSISIDEKSYPDWRAKLNRGLAQLDANEGVELETFLATEKKRRPQLNALRTCAENRSGR